MLDLGFIWGQRCHENVPNRCHGTISVVKILASKSFFLFHVHHLNNTSKTVQEKRPLSIDSFPAGLASVRFQACTAKIAWCLNGNLGFNKLVITIKEVGLLF